MTSKDDELGEKVAQFHTMELPGQPKMMHMGTSFLVSELWRTVQDLRKGRFVDDIQAFHEKFDLTYYGPPRALPVDLQRFRNTFLWEEVTEYVNSDELEDNLDALVDLVYVALGTSYLHGFDFTEAWRRVHEANMKKVRATKDTDSKRGSAAHDVVKPPGWTPPDLTDLVTRVEMR